jgi:hypothetical protein
MNFSAGSGTATIAASTTAPSGVATLDIAHMRSATAGRVTVATSTSAPYTTLAYITLTATTNVSLSSYPTFTITAPAGASGAYYNAQGFWVTLPQSGTFTLANGVSAYFAIYTGGTLPSPNPDGCVGVQTTTRSGAHAALVGVQPIDNGAQFSYTGTLTEAIARATPCAMPTATQQATVSVAVSVTSAPYAIDEHSVENDAYATETTTTTTDANVTTTTYNGAAAFSESAETTSDAIGNQPGDVTVTTYATPLIYAIASLPYTGTVTNGPPSQVQATLADSTTTNRTYNTANGAYTESDTIAGGGANTIAVNADFSGSYTVATGSGQLEAAYSAPSGGSITFTESLQGSTLTSFTIPQWWTGTSLYSDSMIDKGAGALPGPCAPTPTVNTADDFRRTISIVDPVLGYTETETIDAYVVNDATPLGPACVIISDTQKLYYDYFYDTPYSIYLSQSGSPLQTDTIAEGYWYQSAPTGDSRTRTQNANPGGIPGLAASIAAHASGIAFTRSTQRAQRIENFVRSVAAGHIGGVK